MDKFLHYNLSWNAGMGMGMGTNSVAEAKALAGLLAFSMFLDINLISIFGDSKTMVHHVNGNCLLDRIMFFWGQMGGSSIQHVYRNRNRNQVADRLSKEGLQLGTGSWSLQVFASWESFSIQDFCILSF